MAAGVNIGIDLREVLDLASMTSELKFNGLKNTDELIETVRELFSFTTIKINNVEGETQRFKADLSAKIKNVDEVNSFINEYCNANQETLKVATTRQLGNKSPYQFFKRFRCHHNTRHNATKNVPSLLKATPSRRIKNTNCPFSMTVKIMKNVETHPCHINLEWYHNHPLNSLQVNSFRDILPQTAEKVKELFGKGFTPGLAYKEFNHILRFEYTNEIEFHRVKADRSLCPRRPDFNRLYSEYCKEKHGSKNGKEMFEHLEQKIQTYMDKSPESRVKFQRYEEKDLVVTPFILSIITPLMKRVHTMVNHSSEMVFLDSSSNMEEHNLRIFILCTHSIVGALPLGLIICSDEKTETLITAFKIYQDMLPDNAFFGKGKIMGPDVMLTDNCSELRDALSIVWPTSSLLLCTFHLLQQVWRWLFDSNHNINKADRPFLLSKFKAIVYAEIPTQFETLFDEFVSCNLVEDKYPNLASYLENLYEIKESWALSHRSRLRVRGNNTNNYTEAQFLVMKDLILQRIKEYNVNALFDRLTEELENHYKNKLLAAASGSFDSYCSHRYLGKSKKKKEGVGFVKPSVPQMNAMVRNCVRQGGNIFVVPSSSSNNSYVVDMNIGICECEVGKNGAPCKHQFVLWSNQMASSTNFMPIFSAEQRKNLADIAIGQSLPKEYYAGLHDYTHVENIELVSLDSSPSEADIPVELNIFPDEMNASIEFEKEDSVKVEALNALDKAFDNIRTKIENGDNSLHLGIKRFNERVQKMNANQLATSLHTFGVQQFRRKSINTSSSSLLKRSQKFKIGVQPEAVKRRKSKNGSKRALPKGKCSSLLPVKTPLCKRKHEFSVNVSKNEPVAKKAGRSMMSKTKVTVTEKTNRKHVLKTDC